MGQCLASLAEVFLVTAVANAVKGSVHDLSYYVCNAMDFESDCCSCFRIRVHTSEVSDNEEHPNNTLFGNW